MGDGVRAWHHTISRRIPLWPGDPAVQFETVAHLETHGYFLRTLTIGEHSATHLNAPCSFVRGSLDVSALLKKWSANERIFEVAVVPMLSGSPRQSLHVDDVVQFERLHARKIAAGSLVFAFSGWSSKWDDPSAYVSQPFPGIDVEAARFLAEERQICGLGVDTHGVDGADESLATNIYCAERSLMVLECLRLDSDDIGFRKMVLGALDLEGGSGTLAAITCIGHA